MAQFAGQDSVMGNSPFNLVWSTAGKKRRFDEYVEATPSLETLQEELVVQMKRKTPIYNSKEATALFMDQLFLRCEHVMKKMRWEIPGFNSKQIENKGRKLQQHCYKTLVGDQESEEASPDYLRRKGYGVEKGDAPITHFSVSMITQHATEVAELMATATFGHVCTLASNSKKVPPPPTRCHQAVDEAKDVMVYIATPSLDRQHVKRRFCTKIGSSWKSLCSDNKKQCQRPHRINGTTVCRDESIKRVKNISRSRRAKIPQTPAPEAGYLHKALMYYNFKRYVAKCRKEPQRQPISWMVMKEYMTPPASPITSPTTISFPSAGPIASDLLCTPVPILRQAPLPLTPPITPESDPMPLNQVHPQILGDHHHTPSAPWNGATIDSDTTDTVNAAHPHVPIPPSMGQADQQDQLIDPADTSSDVPPASTDDLTGSSQPSNDDSGYVSLLSEDDSTTETGVSASPSGMEMTDEEEEEEFIGAPKTPDNAPSTSTSAAMSAREQRLLERMGKKTRDTIKTNEDLKQIEDGFGFSLL